MKGRVCDSIRMCRVQLRVNGIQLARALLALSTLITLLWTSDSSLFRILIGADDVIACDGVLAFGSYCALPNRPLASLIGVLVCVWVVSGVLPRWSALPQAWIAFSVDSAVSISEGGDQINHNLSLILGLLALLDSRKMGWSLPQTGAARHVPAPAVLQSIDRVLIVIALVQIAFVYFHSAVGKMIVPEWSEGSAVYYILNGQFGGPRSLDMLLGLLANPYVSLICTWAVIVLELLLAISLLVPSRARKAILMSGFVFHCGIIVFMGLWSFGIAMMACLVILDLRPSPSYADWSTKSPPTRPELVVTADS